MAILIISLCIDMIKITDLHFVRNTAQLQALTQGFFFCSFVIFYYGRGKRCINVALQYCQIVIKYMELDINVKN